MSPLSQASGGIGLCKTEDVYIDGTHVKGNADKNKRMKGWVKKKAGCMQGF